MFWWSDRGASRISLISLVLFFVDTVSNDRIFYSNIIMICSIWCGSKVQGCLIVDSQQVNLKVTLSCEAPKVTPARQKSQLRSLYGSPMETWYYSH